MPDDLGKDLNSVDRLKRLHETFEADLAPLEKQVCVHEIFFDSFRNTMVKLLHQIMSFDSFFIIPKFYYTYQTNVDQTGLEKCKF